MTENVDIKYGENIGKIEFEKQFFIVATASGRFSTLMYFDQRAGALGAFCCLKSSLLAFCHAFPSLTGKRRKSIKIKKKYA